MTLPQDKQTDQNFKEIFTRIGMLTRLLRESMANLGLDRAIKDMADAIPDTRERLNYVVGKTSEAAERALSSVETARPLQDTLSSHAMQLRKRWDEWFANPVELSDARELVKDTRAFLDEAPKIAQQTNHQLMEIMMAQDFQDLTGQVIQNLMKVIENVEKELISVLVENMPDMAPSTAVASEDNLKNGPQINPSRQGVVASQEQVDDLLDSLGF